MLYFVGRRFLQPRLTSCSDFMLFQRDSFGEKANEILSAVRGKDFRHEKTKKKRGTYKGGPISTSSSSFKFDSDGN
jgi:hypothetical protein